MQSKKLDSRKAFLAVILLAFTIFSVLYQSHEMYHDCSGDGCQICYVLQVCEQNIKLLSLAFAFAVVFSAFVHIKISTVFLGRKINFVKSTLISQKIRLND